MSRRALRHERIRPHHGGMRRRQLLFAAGAALAAACTPASAGSSAPSSGSIPPDRPNDPNAGNPAAGIWPGWLASQPSQTKQAYLYASQNHAVMQYIPCYCGCGSASHSGGHADNERCYIVSRGTGGWMILEPHATTCGTCVGITLDVKTWLTAGVSLNDVRTRIDQKWSSAGPSTPTKLPPS